MERGRAAGTKMAREQGTAHVVGADEVSNTPEKIPMGENHRLAASVVFRGTERACDSTMEWLDRPSSLLNELRDDITPEEQAQLRKLAGALKEEIKRLAAKVELDRSRSSRRRSIAAILSAALVDLQETQDSQLKGYGVLSPEAKKVLFDGMSRMTSLLEKMLAIAEGPS